MGIEDRVVPDSGEHWALFALDAYVTHNEEPATPEALHRATKERFEDAAWLGERLQELVRRNLVEHTDGAYRPKPSGRVVLKRHGKPSDPPWARSAPQQDEPEEPDGEGFIPGFPPPDELEQPPGNLARSVDNVLYHPAAITGRGEAPAVRMVAESFPDHTILVDVGPHRFYDAAYRYYASKKLIVLDFYSVRPNGEKWGEALVWSLRRDILRETDAEEMPSDDPDDADAPQSA